MADSVGEPEDQNVYVHATLACLPVGLGLGFCPWYVAIAKGASFWAKHGSNIPITPLKYHTNLIPCSQRYG